MDSTARYARQLLFWGEEKQRQIGESTLLIAGVGGLGATVSQLLARAGIGKLYLVDDGLLDLPDLNRQTLYGEQDLGKKKVHIAAERLACINSTLKISVLDQHIDDSFQVPDDVDAVADCLDNFTTRFALYKATVPGTFFVHGGLNGANGQVLTLKKGASQSLETIFAGARQPQGKIPVTPDNVVVIAGLMTNELFHLLWDKPKLLNRFLIVGFDDFHTAFLEV